MDEKAQRRYGVELGEAFPKTVGAQSLSYDATNQQQKITISFSYRYWKSLFDEADLPKPLLDRIATLLRNTVVRKLQSQIPAVLRNL